MHAALMAFAPALAQQMRARMPRLLFTIVSATTGWQLYEGGHGRSWHRNLGEARQNAKLIAATLHEHHGIPTAVILGLYCDSVLLAQHG